MALSDPQASAATNYNRAQKYQDELIEDIQRLVGATVDGKFGPTTARAIAAWQAKEELSADGKVGPGTLEAMEEEWYAADREGDDDGDVEGVGDVEDDGVDDDDQNADWYVDLRQVKPTKPRGYPKRTRKWTTINAITLHQTACVFSGPSHRGVINVPAHAMTFADGQVALLNPPNAYMAHGAGFNRMSIGIEISAHACGVEGVFVPKAGAKGPNTFWRPKSRPTCQPVEVTDVQIEATKRLIRYYIERVKAHHGEIKYVLAHRQSSRKIADPGSRIWKALGIWAQQELGLTAGPTPNYCIDKGQPIPTAWDPRVEGVRYSWNYKGY